MLLSAPAAVPPMCHVIGYAGREQARTRLVEGLARLESGAAPECSGVCLLTGGGLELFRAVGRTETLRVRVNGHGSVATAGIAHTDGRVFGHPVVAGDVAVALHGSITNCAATLTDEEFVAKRVAEAYDGHLGAAVRAAYAGLEGNFAFVAVHDQEPGTVAGARRGCELLAWTGEGGSYLTSSRAALPGREVVPIASVSVVSAEGPLVPA
jgi:glucosamine--fructose-6-phosphate aminotransferase (isomerizing)